MARLFRAVLVGLLSMSSITHAAAAVVDRDAARLQPRLYSYPGSIRVVSSNPPTIKYYTSEPDAQNWIGIWNTASGGAPDAESHVVNSDHWDWAANGEGTVTLPVAADGTYRAFFLSKGGYKWLSLPVDFAIGPSRYGGGAMSVASTSPLRIGFSTDSPGDKNWIGVYAASGGGPDAGVQVKAALAWDYARGGQGNVGIPTDGLAAGAYRAYLLANDGYERIAAPVSFYLQGGGGPGGSLQLQTEKPVDGQDLTFAYSTSQVSSKNWIGIYYASGGGPDNQEHVQNSLAWDWAPYASGTVNIPTSNLGPGSFKAYLLADNGFKWLAEPIQFAVRGAKGFSFVIPEFTTHNARQGDAFRADVSGLTILRDSDNSTRFRGLDAGAWAVVSADGKITGTPPSNARDTTIRVQADNNGDTATLLVKIPVRSAGSPLVEDLKVLSFNLWHGGQSIHNFHEKQIRFIVNSGVDVVGLQESDYVHANRLAAALGWYALQGDDPGTISRYPFQVQSSPDRSGAVLINLDGDRSQIMFWNCHLGYNPYGPYDFCFDHMSREQVFEREKQSQRTPQIESIVAAMQRHLANADNVPVILTGDFNAPSHLDWTEATKSQHCGVGYVDWPTSRIPIDAGLQDSFRVMHPDPVREPGITWSPIDLHNSNGRDEPLDRIDFIYHKGAKLSVLDSQAFVVGNPRPMPNHADNEWPSDHKAVITHYKIRN
ncbi:hypothetical protein PWT90_02567 [Aphanocladium album]|nr:hypothetical protein PWT90_02567 [Aphanocladium album]